MPDRGGLVSTTVVRGKSSRCRPSTPIGLMRQPASNDLNCIEPPHERQIWQQCMRSPTRRTSTAPDPPDACDRTRFYLIAPAVCYAKTQGVSKRRARCTDKRRPPLSRRSRHDTRRSRCPDALLVVGNAPDMPLTRGRHGPNAAMPFPQTVTMRSWATLGVTKCGGGEVGAGEERNWSEPSLAARA